MLSMAKQESKFMSYGSVCSGIEAATVAWDSLGWTPAWFSEIDPFANSVLAHHYTHVPNLGDMTKIHDKIKDTKINLLVGGTPCQSFSQAGLRLAFEDPRGDLALKFLGLIEVTRPEWFVWENVTGVLSADKGRAFGEFTNQIQKLGYGFAWRTLDAQNFGVPQRRRRIFVVGHSRDYRCAVKVLFEREMLQGSFAPNERKEKDSAKVESSVKTGNRAKAEGVDIYNYADTGDIATTFGANSGSTNSHGPKVIDCKGIRKFTPVEVERLMGFPDNYTRVPHKGKTATDCLDSWRWKALGNSIVVPVLTEIGKRIQLVEAN